MKKNVRKKLLWLEGYLFWSSERVFNFLMVVGLSVMFYVASSRYIALMCFISGMLWWTKRYIIQEVLVHIDG